MLPSSSAPSSMASDTERASGRGAAALGAAASGAAALGTAASGAAASGTAADGGEKSGSLSAASFSSCPSSSLATSSQLSHTLCEDSHRERGIEPLEIEQPGRKIGHPTDALKRRGCSFAKLGLNSATRQAFLEQRIPAFVCHALENRGRLLEQRGDPLQAAAVEESLHGSVANILLAMQVEALPGGGVAQLEELAAGGKELARHP
eukprot:scaffold14737_cov68-Phaeocystis_antarctica.AAC.16